MSHIKIVANHREHNTNFSNAHKDYRVGLIKYASFRINDRVLCEDLVQRTFLKTWQYIVKGGEIETMKAFLYHVLSRMIIDEYRKKKMLSLDFLLERGFEPSADETERILSILDGKSAILLIRKLPEAYQKVMHMKYVQDLGLAEMAKLTGQSRNAISVKAHRGLAKIRKLYLKQKKQSS